ncbi:MAG: type II secretion system minor pseudopilin GspH [Gammaproteobacteria bacterium]|nr:type II secretion system minor pseudopilin GspH [Gammaproteobacteria bacterium]
MTVRRCQGFTLIEIMLVVLLISITVTLVTVNLQRDPDQIAEQEAKRFMALVEHVRGESVLTGRTIGIAVEANDNTYSFMRPGGTWSPIGDDDILRTRYVPEYLKVEVEIEAQAGSDNAEDDEEENDEKDEEEKPPPKYIIVSSIGNITPFVFTVSGDDLSYTVSLQDGQNLSFEEATNEAS